MTRFEYIKRNILKTETPEQMAAWIKNLEEAGVLDLGEKYCKGDCAQSEDDLENYECLHSEACLGRWLREEVSEKTGLAEAGPVLRVPEKIERNSINCMNCLEGMRKLPSGCARLIIADPPYSMGLTANGRHGEFTDLEIARPFYESLAAECDRVLAPNGEIYIFMDWRGTAFYYPIFQEYLPIKNMIVWDKLTGPGNFYNSSHEFILYGTKNPQARKHSRNVWRERGFTSGSIKTDGPKIQEAQKPVALIQRIIADASLPGDLVVDPFGGSATTAVAAINTRRDYILFELSPTRAAAAERRVREHLEKMKLK